MTATRKSSRRRPTGAKKLLNAFKKNFIRLLARREVPALHYGRQKWVSERYEVSPSAARKWLQGECLPDWEHMSIIADDLEASIDNLLGRKPVCGSGMLLPAHGGENGLGGESENGLQLTSHRLEHNGIEMHVVSTDCMNKAFNEGDIALVDTESKALKDNRIFLFSIKSKLVFRRVMQEMDGCVTLFCDNDTYPAKTFRPEDIYSADTGSEASAIHVVGEVHWCINRLSGQAKPVIELMSG